MLSNLRAIFCDADEARYAYEQLMLTGLSGEDISIKILSDISGSLPPEEESVTNEPGQSFNLLLRDQYDYQPDENGASIIISVQTMDTELASKVLYDCGAVDVEKSSGNFETNRVKNK